MNEQNKKAISSSLDYVNSYGDSPKKPVTAAMTTGNTHEVTNYLLARKIKQNV